MPRLAHGRSVHCWAERSQLASLGLRALGLCLALLFPVAAIADEKHTTPDLSQASLEDLMNIKVESVYGASKHWQKVTDAPASITIVTSEEIRRFGYRTLGDILRSVPGFYITYDRNYTYASVRGFGRTGDYNSRILLLIDGHPENDDIYYAVDLGSEFPIDVDLIDRVEIIHGPSSSIYGSSALFAVINVITKRGGRSEGLQVAGAAASYDTGDGRVTYGRRFRQGWETLLSGRLYDSHGQSKLYFPEFDAPATNHGIAQDADHEKSGQFFGDLSYRDLRLQGAYASREKGIPTASFGTVFNDSRAQTTDRRGYVDLSYEHKFQKGFDLTGRVYFDSYTYDGIYPYDDSSESDSAVTLNHDYADGKWWGEEARLSKTLFAKHLLTVGNEFRDYFRETQGNFDLDPYFVYLKDDRSSRVWALYAQDEYSLRKNLLLNFGIRHDHYSTFGGTTNPRLGLVYSPLSKTTLKFLYGSAFRAPNAYELYYQDGYSLVPSPNLHPETIHTAEFVVEQYIGERYRMSGSIFHNRTDGLIDQVELPSGFLQFQNASSVRAKGVELVFERKWASGLAAQLNYTFQQAVDRHTGARLVNSPSNLANANLLFPLIPGKPMALTAGLDLHYVSARRTLTGNMAPSFVLMNVTLFTHRLFKGFELSGSLYNLLNTHYGYPGGGEHREDILYQDGRNVRLKLVYTFGGRAR